MTWARAAAALAAVVAVGLVLVSGGSDADPRTPPALPGLPPPFLGTAVVGGGGLTAAVDAYGDVVDLRPGPAGPALIDDPAARQAAGTVPTGTGIVPRVRVGGGAALPLWRADSVSQRYLPGTNVALTVARFGSVRVTVTAAASDRRLAMIVRAGRGKGTAAHGDAPGAPAIPSASVDVTGAACRAARRGPALALVCGPPSLPVGRGLLESQPNGVSPPPRRGAESLLASARAIASRAGADDRAWLAAAAPLGLGAPPWARRLYRRSLLVLHALTDSRTGAVAAGARDGWAYVWPRDAAATAMAYAAAGYRGEARRVARFLAGLDLDAAARFGGDGTPVPGRGPEGDATGWAARAERAARLRGSEARTAPAVAPWRDRPDYQEGAAGDYLGNALAAAAAAGAGRASGTAPRGAAARRGAPPSPSASSIAQQFGSGNGLVRGAHDPASGLDSAAAWAVRPFALPPLYGLARRTLLQIAAHATPYGTTPGEGWRGGADPWTAPTAWSAWSLAALADIQRRHPVAARIDRVQALELLSDLRRAATSAGALPERVGAHTGIPTSTTPLAWSHAFAILALRQLWPRAL